MADFARLFEKRPAPGAFSCWCTYHHRVVPEPLAKGPIPRARELKKRQRMRQELVEKERSHGILVYSEGEPVGWCQYGTKDELPRIDRDRGYQKSVSSGDSRRLWRITCFVADTRHRRRGVASAALKAALSAIRRRGGGLVEAYPISTWGAYREYYGTVSMFRKEGFRVVSSYGKNNLVMRRVI